MESVLICERAPTRSEWAELRSRVERSGRERCAGSYRSLRVSYARWFVHRNEEIVVCQMKMLMGKRCAPWPYFSFIAFPPTEGHAE